MSKKITRLEFLKLSSLSSLGLLLNAQAWGNAENSADQQTSLINTNDSPTPLSLIQKTDSSYDTLRKGFNKRINKYPRAIALCSSTKDVVNAIQYATQHKLAIAVKSGGHSMEGFSSNDDGLVIDLRNMNRVNITPDRKVITEPGCTLARLHDHILPQQLIIPTGTCATVGLGGLTLGGGYGLFSREHGLTCDSLVEATLVDGKGNIISTKDDPELLWALRGGGAGNFGVVTQLIYQAQPAPATMRSHHFKSRKLDTKRAIHLMKTWFMFAKQLPLTCFSAFVLNGSTLNILVTNYAPHSPVLQALLDTFAKQMDEFRSTEDSPLSKKLKAYYGSTEPLYFKNSSAGFYNSFDDIEGFIDKVIAKVISTPRMIYQINTLGGKVKDPKLAAQSCYAHRNYDFISELQAYWENPKQEERLKLASQEILKTFSNNGINSQYINYCSLEFSNWKHAYYGNNYERLQKIKAKYDPDNLIRHPQSIDA